MFIKRKAIPTTLMIFVLIFTPYVTFSSDMSPEWKYSIEEFELSGMPFHQYACISTVYNDEYDEYGRIEVPSEMDGIPVEVIQYLDVDYADSMILPEGLIEIREYVGCVKDLYIPSTVSVIRPDSTGDVSEYHISPDNRYFKAKDHSLVSYDGKTLLAYNEYSENENYFLPDGVEIIAEGSVGYLGFNIGVPTAVTISSTLKEVQTGGFEVCYFTRWYFSSEHIEIQEGAFKECIASEICFCKCPDFETAMAVEREFVENSNDQPTMKFYPLYDEMQYYYYDFGKNYSVEDFKSFMKLTIEGKYDEALAIQNLDGKHPSAPSGSGNGAQPAEPQTPTSSNTVEPSGQLANNPSIPGTQLDPLAQTKPGEDPASSSNSGTTEPSEEHPVTRKAVPLIAAALIIVVIGAAVIVRKRK